MTLAVSLSRWHERGMRLRRDSRGVALLEFAFGLPLVLGIGLYATETANLAIANLRVSQIALNLADNASRVGSLNNDNTKQLREIDINDVLIAAAEQGKRLELTQRGRITISSLEQAVAGVQYLHWQRCLGMKGGAGYDSTYDRTLGTMDRDDGTGTNWWNGGVNQPTGMGETGSKVNSPVGSGVMVIEIVYDYKPVVVAAWLPGGAKAARIRYTASYVVRDRRDFSQIYNPSPPARQYFCDLYSAT